MAKYKLGDRVPFRGKWWDVVQHYDIGLMLSRQSHTGEYEWSFPPSDCKRDSVAEHNQARVDAGPKWGVP